MSDDRLICADDYGKTFPLKAKLIELKNSLADGAASPYVIVQSTINENEHNAAHISIITLRQNVEAICGDNTYMNKDMSLAKKYACNYYLFLHPTEIASVKSLLDAEYNSYSDIYESNKDWIDRRFSIAKEHEELIKTAKNKALLSFKKLRIKLYATVIIMAVVLPISLINNNYFWAISSIITFVIVTRKLLHFKKESDDKNDPIWQAIQKSKNQEPEEYLPKSIKKKLDRRKKEIINRLLVKLKELGDSPLGVSPMDGVS